MSERREPAPAIKIPISLIGTLWMILISILGVGWKFGEENIKTQKNVESLTRSVTRLERQLALTAQYAYPRHEADKDAKATDFRFTQIESRVTNLESKRR